MRSVEFPGWNICLNKPESMTDEDCFSISAMKGVIEGIDAEGKPCVFPFYITKWVPNKEDMEALNRGESVYIRTLGIGFQPMAVFTLNEEGIPNEFGRIFLSLLNDKITQQGINQKKVDMTAGKTELLEQRVQFSDQQLVKFIDYFTDLPIRNEQARR